jgi:hypothetical protein
MASDEIKTTRELVQPESTRDCTESEVNDVVKCSKRGVCEHAPRRGSSAIVLINQLNSEGAFYQ